MSPCQIPSAGHIFVYKEAFFMFLKFYFSTIFDLMTIFEL